MNLVENLARRQHHSLDLLRDIKRLKDSRYSEHEIAAKTPLSMKYVHGVIRLLESHEHRLLRAVESRKIPVSVAVDIADADGINVQTVLRKAYATRSELLFSHAIIENPFLDENFVTLLRAEGLTNIPKAIADRASHIDGTSA